jgi:hypothetical protein
MRTLLKILLFAAFMGVYLFFAGRPGWNTLFGRKLTVIYGFGAVIALWFGREPIGTLHPVALRPIFILCGAMLMLAIFVLMLNTRDVARQLDRGANQRGTEDAATPVLFHAERQWRGASDPGRWAAENCYYAL